MLESHGVTRGPVHKNARVHRGIYGAATSRAVEDVLCSREEAGQPVCQDRGRVTAERRDTGQLVRQAVSEGRHAYMLVNNRSEENAPLPV